jgi:tetratricopeptide repeat protein
MHAVSQLAIAWVSPITDAPDSAFRAASVALGELRSQDEPLWTALAAGTLGSMQTSAGLSDDALSNLREVRDLGDRLDSAWLAAWSRTQLGIVAIMQDRLDQASELLDEALTRSVRAHSTGSVTLCLMALARLALAEGDPERAALLAGAAGGLRQRVGLRVWPMLRRGEAELIAQIRQASGLDRFSQIAAAGSRLSSQQAVAAIGRPQRPGSPERGLN